jgi:maltooligosyltrehalose trehalohydrolase
MVDGAVLGPAGFVLRYLAGGQGDRLLIVNLGRRQELKSAPEPLLAPPLGFEWETLWTSESPRYAGPGAVPVVTEDRWLLPAEAAVALQLVPEKAPRRKPKRRP